MLEAALRIEHREERCDKGVCYEEEDAWGGLPVHIVSKIARCAADAPESDEWSRDWGSGPTVEYRGGLGGLRLVNRQWCTGIDRSVSVLMPDWSRVEMGDVLQSVRSKFQSVQKIAAIESPRDKSDTVEFESCSPGAVYRLATELVNWGCRKLTKWMSNCPDMDRWWPQDAHPFPVKHLDFSRLCCTTKMTGNDQNWTFLARLTNLQSLNLSGCAGVVNDANLELLSGLLGLTQLDISNSCERFTGEGLRHVTTLNRLTYLDMSRCPNVLDRNVSAVGHLTSLRHLDLNGCSKLSGQGLSVLSRLARLTYLDIRCDWDRTSSGVLPHLVNLTCLKTLGCDLDDTFLPYSARTVSDFQYVALLGLESLNGRLREVEHELGSVQQSGLALLSGMKTLRELSIDSNTIRKDSWASLNKLCGVSRLELSSVAHFDIEEHVDDIVRMDNLQSLVLNTHIPECGFPLNSLTRLVNLTSLSIPYLTLSGTDMESLLKLTQLEQLSVRLEHYQIGDFMGSVAWKLNRLKVLALFGCMVWSDVDSDRVLALVFEALLLNCPVELRSLDLCNFAGTVGGCQRPKYSANVLGVMRQLPNLHITM